MAKNDTTAKELTEKSKALAKKIEEVKAISKKFTKPIKPKKQLNCFIIMPFSEAIFTDTNGKKRKLNQKTLTYIYEKYFLKAIESFKHDKYKFINPHRNTNKRGNFVKEIITNLKDYDLVIADLTSLNPNVFYELGIRHTLHAGTILITQEKKPASDLGSYIKFNYQYPEEPSDVPKCYEEFEREMHNALNEFLEQPDKPDSPVLDYIGQRHIFRNEIRIKEIEGNIELMIYIKEAYSRNVFWYINDMRKWLRQSEAYGVREGMSNIVMSFINKITNSNENLEIVSFLSNILLALKQIEFYINKAKSEFKKSNKLETVRKFPLFFCDRHKVEHHLLDLMPLYSTVESKEIIDDGFHFTDVRFFDGHLLKLDKEEPMLKSFDFFIDEWKKELEELTQ